MLTVIVLAAGLSRRMGLENKLLLPFGDKTIVETTIENILAAHIGEVIVVVGHEAEALKKVLNNRFDKIHIVENPDFEQGMTTSIKVGIRASFPPPQRGDHGTERGDSKTERGDGEVQNREGYMICLADMVLIEPEEYRFLAQQFLFYDFYREEEHAIFQPVFEGQRGNPVIFSNFYKNELLETTDTEGARSVVQKYKKQVKLVEMKTNHVLQDVDFKEDYAKLVATKRYESDHQTLRRF